MVSASFEFNHSYFPLVNCKKGTAKNNNNNNKILRIHHTKYSSRLRHCQLIILWQLHAHSYNIVGLVDI